MMKTKLFTAMCMFLATIFFFPAISGCAGKKDSGVIIDKNRETINISVFSAGFGSSWLVDMLNEYNKATSSSKYQFNRAPENTNSLSTITQQVKAGISNSTIFFNDESDFYELANLGKLLDMSDIWDYKPDASEPDRTVREKIVDTEMYEQAYTVNGKIYGLPFTQGLSGIIYDHDLFKEFGWLKEDSGTANGLSVGTDGKEGTYDDGLPETMEEFDILCARIRADRMWPFIYSDQVGGGVTMPLIETIWGMYDGYENYYLSYSYDGTYKSPSTGAETEITPDKGYLIYQKAEGRFKAVDFMRDFVLNTNYYNSAKQGISHTASEEQFIFSHAKGQTRVAMTFNGCWWENEARAAFNNDAKRNGEEWGFGKRDFRYLPMPAYYGQDSTSGGMNYFSTNANGSVVALDTGNAEKNKAIKDFLKFFVSDEGLSFFTSQTGAIPAYNYKLSDEQLAGLTPFGRNQYEIIMSETAKILRPSLLRTVSPLNYFYPITPKRWWAVYSGNEYTHCYDAMVRMGAANYKTAIENRYNATTWKPIYDQIAANA